MHQQASKIIAQDFLRGFFDTVDALLAVGVTASVGDAVPLTLDGLKGYLASPMVVMRGNVDDSGVVAILMAPHDALYLASMVMGEEPPADEITEIPDAAMANVREVFDSCLGGGCGTLKDTFRRELAFKDVTIVQGAADTADALLAVIGPESAAASYSFSSPSGIGGDGWILVANKLSGFLPDEAMADAAGPGGPELSSDEMKDILSGFSPDDGAPPKGAAPQRPVPGNLDMIMDIRLVCTARLGRVEMPIGEILDLGPGSIIEVGHLVDEPVELLVNDKLIARGDVVVVDEKFGLRITEIISTAERIKSLR